MGHMIRSATMSEVEPVLHLWHSMLAETYGLGGEILPSAHNLAVYANVIVGYLEGVLDGVVLVAEGEDGGLDGVLVWGQGADNPFETRWGRTAMGWGVYCDPRARGQGLSSDLRREGRRLLREKGFESVIGSAVDSNAAGIASGLSKGGGFKRHGIVGVIDLREKEGE